MFRKRLDLLQKSFCLFQLWEGPLLRDELPRMHAPAAAAQLHRMLQVQHLVEDDVLNHKSRHARVVKYPADDYCVMGRVVVAEAVAGVITAPRELRTSHQTVEEP